MIAKAKNRLAKELTTLRVLGSAGVIHPYPPSVLAGIVRALRDWGMGPAGGFTTLAVRARDQVGVIDELGELERRRLELAEERDRALAALKELELDHRTGKVSDADYRALVGPLRREAAEALRALEPRAEGAQRVKAPPSG